MYRSETVFRSETAGAVGDHRPPAPDRPPVRVLLATDAVFYRDGLAEALARRTDLHLVDVADDAGTTVRLATASRPDVVLLDATMPGSFPCTQELRSLAPQSHVVVMAIVDELGIVPWAEAGARGYVTRSSGIDAVVATVRSAARGEFACSPRVAAALGRRLEELASEARPAAGGPASLTRREREIVDLIDRGLSNKEIAGRLVIQVSTVKNHVHRILEKLGVDGRRDAATIVRHYRGGHEGARR
jgi:two-component system, NarL family, nitrate/nitrite response regulator NarL